MSADSTGISFHLSRSCPLAGYRNLDLTVVLCELFVRNSHHGRSHRFITHGNVVSIDLGLPCTASAAYSSPMIAGQASRTMPSGVESAILSAEENLSPSKGLGRKKQRHGTTPARFGSLEASYCPRLSSNRQEPSTSRRYIPPWTAKCRDPTR